MSKDIFKFQGIDKKSNWISGIIMFFLGGLCGAPILYFYAVPNMNMYKVLRLALIGVMLAAFIYLKIIAPKLIKEWIINIKENDISIFFNNKLVINMQISDIIKIKYVKTKFQRNIIINQINSKIHIRQDALSQKKFTENSRKLDECWNYFEHELIRHQYIKKIIMNDNRGIVVNYTKNKTS